MKRHALDSQWKVWQTVLVRGAGFPAKLVLDLASPGLLERADGVLELSQGLQAAQNRALGAVRSEYSGRPDKALLKIIKSLEAGRVVEPSGIGGLDADSMAVVQTHNAAVAARTEAIAALKIAIEEEDVRIGEIVRGYAGSPLLREAVTWQNPVLIERCFDQLTRAPAKATAKTRRYQRTVASYMQRYATKNDTIGFFGPVGWASIAEDGPSSIKPGPTLLAHREVYFEHWAIDTLATHLSSDGALRAYLMPRMNSAMRIEGTTLHLPISRTTELPLAFARAARAATGERYAHEIAAELAADAELELTIDDAYGLLDELVANGIITWTLEIPTSVAHPEAILRSLLEHIPDPDATAHALEALGELERLRDEVARSAGDADALGRSMAKLREAFTRITEADAERHGGQTYAGRTLLFLDSRRDLELSLDRHFLDPFAPTLGLLLQSSRWFTHTIAARTRTVLEAAYRELVQETGEPQVEFIRFFDKVGDHLLIGEKPPPIVVAAIAELQEKWARILGLKDANGAIELRAADIADRVASEFAASGAAWPSATYHSPDIMVIANGPDAFCAGRVSLVLGEVHVAVNSISPRVERQHPEAKSLVAARLEDIPVGQIAPVIGKGSWNNAASYSNRPGDLDIELGGTRSPRPRTHVIAAADLVLEEIDGNLRARTRDGTRTFELEELFDDNLTSIATGNFKLIPPLRHGPRVTVDGVVMMRESWRFETSELPFIGHMEPVDRLLAVRQFALQHQLPRFLFYKFPTEPKPLYLDLASPIYVDQFAHLARQAPHVALSEMKPDLRELWLTDANGELYTSELRIIAIDPVPWRR